MGTTQVRFPAFKGLAEQGQNFLVRLGQAALRLHLVPEDLATVIAFETGPQAFQANALNKQSGAIGLIQFLPSTAKTLGTTADALAKMTNVEQLDWVEAFYNHLYKHGFSPPKTLEDTYLMVFSPAFANKPPETVAYSDPSPGYRQNKGFDKDGKGYITVADISRTIRAKRNSVPAGHWITTFVDPDAPNPKGGSPTTGGDVGGKKSSLWPIVLGVLGVGSIIAGIIAAMGGKKG